MFVQLNTQFKLTFLFGNNVKLDVPYFVINIILRNKNLFNTFDTVCVLFD